MNTFHPPKGGRKFLRANAVALRYDTTASTIWRWSRVARFAHLNFPKPIRLGPNTTGFSVDELDAYDAERIAMRDAPSEPEAA